MPNLPDLPRGRSQFRVHLGIIVAAFVVTRLWAWQMGLHHLSGLLPQYWQLLGLDLLRDDLARGLLDLHAQPPLYNAIVGLALKIGGAHVGEVLLLFQMGLGLAAAIAVYLTLRRLRVAGSLSLVVTLLLVLNPTAILFEGDALYTEQVYALLCFVAYAGVRYLVSRSAGALLSFAVLVGLLPLLRSSYQPIWVVMLFAVLLWATRGTRRPLLAPAFAVALAMALLWPVKNYLLFRHFSSSTWASFSMSKHWRYPEDRKRIARWVAAGSVPTFSPRPMESGATEREYPAWVAAHYPVPATGRPELDDVAKGDTGWPNWNSLAMLQMHDAQQRDVNFLLRHAPKSYLFEIGRGLFLFFEPAPDYFKQWGGETVAQYQRFAGLDRLSLRLCCSPLVLPPEAYSMVPPAKLHLRDLCVGSVLLYGYLFVCLVTLFVPRFWGGDQVKRNAAALLLATVAYIFVLANLLEVGENMRFRFETQALALMAAAVFTQRLMDRRRVRRAGDLR